MKCKYCKDPINEDGSYWEGADGDYFCCEGHLINEEARIPELEKTLNETGEPK